MPATSSFENSTCRYSIIIAFATYSAKSCLITLIDNFSIWNMLNIF